MIELQLENINVTINNKKILNEINLDVKKGEIISLLGPSGCGKSTLLKTIAGLLEPEKGNVLLSGSKANGLMPNKRGTVIVFQDLRLFPHLNVLENVAFGLKMQGVDKQTRTAKALAILKKVALDGLANRKVNEISGGQMQRVALSRALAANPKVLLLDEPFSSLDEALRQKMRVLIRELHQELGITMILVAHDQQEALMMSDRVAVMLEGRIVQYDKPYCVYNAPVCEDIANYFGETNYIDGSVKEGRFISDLVSFTTAVPAGSYKAMFRPAAIQILQREGQYQISAVSYLGESCRVKVHGLGRQFLITTDAEANLEVGSKVDLKFNTSRAIMFESKAK